MLGKYDDTILELALLGGNNPTIMTADGRSLRRRCPISEETCSLNGENCICDGRIWLPMTEDTAVVVIIEYAHEQQDGGHLLEAICEGLWRTPEVPAAVFAAALKAASG